MFNYILVEVMVALVVVVISWKPRTLSRQELGVFTIRAGLLFGLWFVVDQIAIMLELWWFPPGASLPFRFLSLPPEEYFLFFLHSWLCLVLLQKFRRDYRE